MSRQDGSRERGTGRQVRFGVFEVDLDAGELRKGGVPVKLQVQPFQVLKALLERPGQLVSREQLQRRIWPADTGVDFEHGLNKAINRLRAALGNSPEAPSPIETLARRGYRFTAKVERKIGSIAVLPLETLSGEPGQEFWADGITDELTAELARASTLRVVSRTSVMRFKGTTAALSEIAEALGVDAVVQGSVTVTGKRLRMRVQLVDPYADQHLCSEAYEHDLTDAIALQVAIVRTVATRLRALLAGETGAAVRARPLNPAAYELYLRGRFFWNSRTEISLQKSVDCFQRAIELEPHYAAAHAGAADAHMVLGTLGIRPPVESYPRARASATRALELDETLAEAHATLGEISKNYDWDWPCAETAFRRALELDPNRVSARMWYAHLLTLLGRFDEAIAQAERARDLDPLSVVVGAYAALMLERARRCDEAIETCRNAVELDPRNPFGHWILSRILAASNAIDESLAAAEVAFDLSGGGPEFMSSLGYARARNGDETGARELIERLQGLGRTRYVSAYDVALIYVGLGERDPAFEWLDKAADEHAPRMLELPDAIFDTLRSDSRFADLTRRIGLLER